MATRNDLLQEILISIGGDPSPDLSRNKILEAIVTELGGTVTNPSNRNALLQDCLNAITSS